MDTVWDWLPTALAFLAIYLLLIGFYSEHWHKPLDLLLSQTTTSGGDTGAHHYPAQYLIQELLPNGRLTGWAPGWYAGMPMLTFYFPFPFLLIAILDSIMPYAVAFKLVTALGVFLLPVTAYGMARLWRIRRPFPVIAAVFAAGFLLMEKSGGGQLYSIYGGNILSTLAGEFGYMLSFALVFLFLGSMYRGMQKPRLNMLLVFNCLLLMALALSHIVTTIVLVALVPGLLLPGLFASRPEGERLGWVQRGYLVALVAYLFCIAAFLRLPDWAFGVGGVVFIAGIFVGLVWPMIKRRSSATSKALGYLLGVGALGFCLTAFWSLPFAANLEWTSKMPWDQLPLLGKPINRGAQLALLVVGAFGVASAIGLGLVAKSIGKRALTLVITAIAVTLAVLAVICLPFLSSYLLPGNFIPLFVLGIVGMAFALARREVRILPLVWMTVVAFMLYALLPDKFALWNGRLLSFWYFSFYIWSAYAVTWLLRCGMVFLWDLLRLQSHVARRVYVPFVAIVVLASVGATSTVAGGWIRWNYTGYEKKDSWPEYREILDYIGTLPKNSRVMVEHGSKIDQFGTPRAFEVIPYWTLADTMEGTLMEASYTAPFHFINQRELSEQSSNAIIGVAYPPDIDVTRGITHLQLMAIPYLLAFYNDESERVVPAVDADPRAELLKSFGDYRLYKIKDTSDYVEIMKNEPVRVAVDQEDWLDMAVDWYKNPEALDTPLVWDNGEEVLQQFVEVSPQQALYPPEVPITTQGTVSNVKLENESLSFDTTAIGEPHWVKISYFPNWHVKGAEGPFLASPSLMMVIPTSNHVELYYGGTSANVVGQILQTIAWALLLGLTVWRLVVRIKRREALVPTPPPLPVDAGTAGREDAQTVGYDQEDGADYLGAGHEEPCVWHVPPPGVYEADDQHIPDFEEDSPRS